MEPLIPTVIAAVAKDKALELFGAQVKERIVKLIASSDIAMTAAMSELQQEQDIKSVVLAEIALELQQNLTSVQTLDDVERRFQAATTERKPSLSDSAKVADVIVKQMVRTSGRGKRAILAAALVNSYDPEVYQLGATDELLEILEKLSPPDITTLEACESQQLAIGERENFKSSHYSSAIKLLDLRLALDLRGAGVLRFGLESRVYATELGRQVLRLIRGYPRQASGDQGLNPTK
jgi:hypothetical protein